MKIALFLGAGASVPFGKPTTAQLRSILTEKYNDRDFHDNLLQTILNTEGFKDIEYVLRAIQEFDDFSNTFGSELIREFERKRLGHQIVSYGGNGYSYSQVTKELAKIRKTVEDEVFENYSWNHEDNSGEKLDVILDPLIELLTEKSESVRIFTTNYDLTIEEYCKVKNYVCVDGFKPDPFSGRAFWAKGDFSYFDNDANITKIYLYKLHGSLGWKVHRKDGLERTIYERKSQYPNYVKDLLIYPILDPKHENNVEPFSSIRKKFDEYLEELDVCITIGYSFRDSHVNEIFKKFIEKGGNFISFGPHTITDYHVNLLKKQPDEKTLESWTGENKAHFIAKTDPDGPVNRNVHLNQTRLNENTINQIIKTIKNNIKTNP